ncbi:PGF-CTERM sorting domain-containing protein [Halopelagius longus]|uniref:PGF-CTERM sorting domain-containing protein n=1 Tax=Halopelagius longus TaxID=1236180 RepID=A0A370IQP5_9EURY|nr:PGF-CTERM sorting domain-containing protein [Halopelagius longus]
MAAMLVVAAVAPAAGAATATEAQESSASAYAGTHVAFDTESNAVTNYSVDGAVMMDSLRVEAASESESSGSTGLDGEASLSVEADAGGSAVSVTTTAEANATVETESGATLRAHDNPKGSLVVESGNGTQVVRANVSDGATASAEGDSRVVVERDNSTGVFVAVGNASVNVTDDGDVSAQVEEDGRVVFRAYAGERSESDERAEAFIANGTATAQVYVDERNGSRTTDVVNYGSNTTVEFEESSDESVTMTVDRPVHNGTVVLTSVSDAVVNSSGDLNVSVDGEAAAEASTYAELASAANDGERSAFLVANESADASAEGQTDVYVALNHFSERTVTMQSENETTETATETSSETETAAATATDESTDASEETTDASETTESSDASETDHGEETSSTSAPGFGAAVSVVALLGAALAALRR